MDDSYSYWQRNELKQEIIRTRTDIASGGFGFHPRCAICGDILYGGESDMHEVLITRGDIRGQEHLLPYIMVKANCVLVCPGGSGSKCHSKAETKEGQRICIKHLLQFESEDRIIAFLDTLAGEMKSSNQADEAKALVLSVISEVNRVEAK